MKSSAHKALAALQHKYQNLIRQHGSSKQALHCAAEQAKFDALRIGSLRTSVSNYIDMVVDRIKTIERLEGDVRVLEMRIKADRGSAVYSEDYKRMQVQLVTADSLSRRLAGELEDVKHSVLIFGGLAAVAAGSTVYALHFFGII